MRLFLIRRRRRHYGSAYSERCRASLRSREERELIGRVLVGTNDYSRGIFGFGGRFESDDNRILSPGMSKFSHGDVGIRLGGDLPVSPDSTVVTRTYLLDGLIQEVLRLLAGL